MKAKFLTVALIVSSFGAFRAKAGEQTSPPLSLVQAAQIAERKIAEAKMPPEDFLRDVKLRPLSLGEMCYEAYFEPPISPRDYLNAGRPPIILHYVQIKMDGTATFQTRTIAVAH